MSGRFLWEMFAGGIITGTIFLLLSIQYALAPIPGQLVVGFGTLFGLAGGGVVGVYRRG